jgi:hypothetical protein
MLQVRNTNLTINDGAYILTLCPSGNSTGNRKTVICYNLKETSKKYKDWYLFGSPMKYVKGIGFLALRKSFKPKTKNKAKVVVGNAIYFIEKAIKEDNLIIEF